MDPFEARLQFIQLLETLTPSTQAISKGVSFALKNQELHEDFHSCILEVLDRIDLNCRINVLYFIEALVSAIKTNTSKEVESPYLNNLQKDFAIILSKIIPNQNLINLKSSSDILTSIEKYYDINSSKLKNKFDSISIEHIDEDFNVGESEPDFKDAWNFLILNKQIGLKQRIKQFNEESDFADQGDDSLKPFTKDQILNRIEADRERYKRFKEVNWIVNRPNAKIDYNEFEKIWNQHEELDDDDYQDLKELNQIAKKSYQV